MQTFASSHCASAVHVGVQAGYWQPSPDMLLPSSHCSEAAFTPSPQTTGQSLSFVMFAP